MQIERIGPALLPHLEQMPWTRRTKRPEAFAPVVKTLLETALRVRLEAIEFGKVASDGNDYSAYLQFPNARIAALASTIVEPNDSDDVKAKKLLEWVIENVKYQSDIKTYGTLELWALPTVTAKTRVGDCEDGAFLLHSLMLNAGVPSETVRTYGGLVGPRLEGHAYTVFRRSLDDAWVILDWCYWPSDMPIAERSPMEQDSRCAFELFYVEATKTVEFARGQRVDVIA